MATEFNINGIYHKLQPVIKRNRQVINGVRSWMPDLSTSYFDYGIPADIRGLIDLPIDDEVIYTDLISWCINKLEKVNYLEIGVSVGKNFLPLANTIKHGSATAFDIENINPILEEKFSEKCELVTWSSPVDSIRKERAKVNSYSLNNCSINYVAADVYDEAAWQFLSGKKFNVIFSDALHDPKALLYEYEMIKKYRLLDNDFIVFWDDLHGKMYESFLEIGNRIKRSRLFKKTFVYSTETNGWLGQNYPFKHPVGIVSSFDINKL